MNVMAYVRSFLSVFTLAFVAGTGLTYLYGFLFQGAGHIDWATAVRLGIILGITWPLVSRLESSGPHE